jgi:hypothetical protein
VSANAAVEPASPAERGSWTAGARPGAGRPDGRAAPASARAAEGVAVAVLLGLAVALRVHGLSTFPLEQDELYTIDEGRDLLHTELRPGIAARPLYYLLVHPVLLAFPHTPVLLRLLPFVFGIAGVGVTWWLARRTVGRSAGLAALVFVAVSPWHLYVSGMARYWSLVYLLAAGAYGLLPRALERDTRRGYLGALIVFVLGTATHPSFLFPVAGAVAGAHLVRDDGTIGPRWPTRTAWAWLWGPYAVALLAGVLAVRAYGSSAALHNWSGRSAAADLRLVPAIIEWATPALCTAAGAAILLMLGDRDPARRRWAFMAGIGIACSVGAVVVSSRWTNVYADYAMAALPLIIVSAAALPQLALEGLGAAAGGIGRRSVVLAAAVAAVVVAGVLPATASHLVDGTRFEYRPAYRRITADGPKELVVTWPIGPDEEYGPGLRTADLTADTAGLNATLRHEGSIWVVASEKRYGLVGDDGGALAAWLLGRCRLVLVTQRPRFDDRLYRVNLFRCGPP